MKSHTIRLFIWGYQEHFRASVQFQAEQLFHALHPELDVETFLLGLRHIDATDGHPVCLEPEDCGFQPSHFEGVRDDAAHRSAIDPESNVMCSDEGHHQAFHARVRSRGFRNAVLAQVNGWRKERPGEYFFSGFMPVGDYDVGIVLRLHYKAGGPPYRLPKVHAEERYGPHYSLVEAAVDEFFSDCRQALNKPDPRHVADLGGRPVDEILRKAGDCLMETPVWAAKSFEGMYGLFNACNVISALRYESAESVGRMLVSRHDHKNVHHTIKLLKPVSLTQHRAVRKLLQVAASGDGLLCDGASITGFGSFRGNYNQAEADLFEIQFTSHYTWELLHGGHRLMRVAYGNPRLPLKPLDEEKLGSDLQRIFPKLLPAERETLVTLAVAACGQRHGALLIISSEAEQEAKRLARQSTPIEPIKLTAGLIAQVTSIDGALLLDPSGVCFSIGVILDGLATLEGDPGRGARYNSSLRYVSGRQGCMAVIISEDGTAEWVPNLRPQICRKDLTRAGVEVQELLQKPELAEDRARKVLKWLHDHPFYLPQELCKQGNQLQALFDEMLRKDGAMVWLRPPLQPDPDMNDSYLID